MKIEAILVCHSPFELITLAFEVKIPKPLNSESGLCVSPRFCLSLTSLVVGQPLTIDSASAFCIGLGWCPTLSACAKHCFILLAITWFAIEDAKNLLSFSLNIEDTFVACRDSFCWCHPTTPVPIGFDSAQPSAQPRGEKV